jgi:hypothetical protein
VLDLSELHQFAIAAKKATYVGSGSHQAASRPGAHELAFKSGAFAYLDSYFGGTDFLGQEVIWFQAQPVWAMNYYGRILRADLIDGQRAAETLRAALASDGSEGRLLDALDWNGPHGHYCIRSTGDIAGFKGRETISCSGALAYELDYHGGLVKP